MSAATYSQRAVDFVMAIPKGVFAEDLFAPSFWAWTSAMGAFDGATFKQQIPLVGAVFPKGMRMSVDHVIAEGKSVSVQARAEGKLSTGNTYKQSYIFILEFDEDDRVRHFREYMDPRPVIASILPAMEQLARSKAASED